MRKSYFDFVSYSVYKYAPETFTLYFNYFNKQKNKQKIELSYEEQQNFGLIAITKGKQELEKHLKKFFRTKSNFCKQHRKLLQAIPQVDNKNYIHIGQFVSQYNIEEKLSAYKLLKKTLINSNYQNPIIITKIELDGNYKPIQVENQTQKLQLANRIKLII